MIWNSQNAYEIINIDWKSINHLFVHLNGSVTSLIMAFWLERIYHFGITFVIRSFIWFRRKIHSQWFTMELPKGESFYDFRADNNLYPSRTSSLHGVFCFVWRRVDILHKVVFSLSVFWMDCGYFCFSIIFIRYKIYNGNHFLLYIWFIHSPSFPSDKHIDCCQMIRITTINLSKSHFSITKLPAPRIVSNKPYTKPFCSVQS